MKERIFDESTWLPTAAILNARCRLIPRPRTVFRRSCESFSVSEAEGERHLKRFDSLPRIFLHQLQFIRFSVPFAFVLDNIPGCGKFFLSNWVIRSILVGDQSSVICLKHLSICNRAVVVNVPEYWYGRFCQSIQYNYWNWTKHFWKRLWQPWTLKKKKSSTYLPR